MKTKIIFILMFFLLTSRCKKDSETFSRGNYIEINGDKRNFDGSKPDIIVDDGILEGPFWRVEIIDNYYSAGIVGLHNKQINIIVTIWDQNPPYGNYNIVDKFDKLSTGAQMIILLKNDGAVINKLESKVNSGSIKYSIFNSSDKTLEFSQIKLVDSNGISYIVNGRIKFHRKVLPPVINSSNELGSIAKKKVELSEVPKKQEQPFEWWYPLVLIFLYLFIYLGYKTLKLAVKKNFEAYETPKSWIDRIPEYIIQFFTGKVFSPKDKKINNYWLIGLSTFIGFFLGWYFKVPNTKLLGMLLSSNSLWRKDLALEYLRKKSPFFSTELFSFNWIVFIFSTVICFFILMYLNDVKFRLYIHDKIESFKLKRQ